MILGSALFIDCAVRSRAFMTALLYGSAALFLVYVNTKQATRTLSLDREAATQSKLTEIAGGSQVASQRSQLLAQRAEQVKLAGEKAVGTLETEYKTAILSDPKRWEDTSQCEDVQARKSGTYCTDIAKAKGRWEAGKERIRLDGELAKLPKVTAVEVAATGDTKTEIVADAYVANIAALAKELGYQPTERLIKAEEVLSRAFSFELLAALGPTGWLMFVGMMQHGAGHVASAMSRLRGLRRKKAPKQEPARLEPTGADDVDRCITELFEDSSAGSMLSKQIRPLAKAWFDAKGLPFDETKLWPRLGQRFKYDPNNNRPRYIGLKPRPKPGLRVVSSNEEFQPRG